VSYSEFFKKNKIQLLILFSSYRYRTPNVFQIFRTLSIEKTLSIEPYQWKKANVGKLEIFGVTRRSE